MGGSRTEKTIDIRPGVSVLAVLRHLNYKPWHALAEFVDNSVQSFIRNRTELQRLHGDSVKLRVDIDVDSNQPPRISIRDNAAGISEADYPRAFRPAAIPPDRGGLAEFGMGMKSAACWFAPKWSVRTSALGESVARSVHFNIANIVNDDINEVTIQEQSEKASTHYTEVVLEDVFQVPAGRTVGKLKEHLTDIYRDFIRNGILELRFNQEPLVYKEPPILKAPYFKEKDEAERVWRKSIEFDLGNGLAVHGFAALFETANTARAGFSLFRRGRVVQGSGDEGYRPSFIFGSSNSYRFQRLFGELHLTGFDVSHTKDGFRWDDNEQPFLELLREHLDSDELPLLRQAEGFRARAARPLIARAAQKAIQSTTDAIQNKLPEVLPGIAAAAPIETATEETPHTSTLASRRLELTFRGVQWLINVELTDDASEGQWLALTDTPQNAGVTRLLDIRVSTAHPFMIQFVQPDSANLEALLRVGAAIALAEIVARDSGVRMAGTIRRNMNEILRDALSEQ